MANFSFTFGSEHTTGRNVKVMDFPSPAILTEACRQSCLPRNPRPRLHLKAGAENGDAVSSLSSPKMHMFVTESLMSFCGN